MSRRSVNPLPSIGRGLVAGAVGTATMDALLFTRYRREGGERAFTSWELSSGLSTWEDAPAPAQVGKRVWERLVGRPLPATRAALTNNMTHWAYGIAGGAQYGLAAGSLRPPRIVYGLPFGVMVWGVGYVVLPLMKLYKPIWKYDRKTLAKDLSAHLVYGLGTATALGLLSNTGPSRA